MASFAAVARAADPFYETLFRRGVADYDQGRFDAAASELRIAVFGFMDSIPRFELANGYYAAATHRLGREDEARAALQKIVTAEKIQRSYAAIELPAAVRTAVDALARTLLTAEEQAVLRATPAAAPTASTPAPPPAQPVAATPSIPATGALPRVTRLKQTGGREEVVSIPDPTDPSAGGAVATQLASGDAALVANDLSRASATFAKLLRDRKLTHQQLLRIGEGLYRARDFRDAVRAFSRAGTFAAGEEPYRFYYAAALYETKQLDAARRELRAALPYVASTPEVEAWRRKIE